MPLDETPGTISEPQTKFIRDLVAKKDLHAALVQQKLSEQQYAYLQAGEYSGMSKFKADKAIKLLLSLNEKPVQPAKLPEAATSDFEPPHSLPEFEPTADSNPVPPLNKGAREVAANKLTELEAKVEPGYYFVVNDSLIKNGRDPAGNDGERFYHVSKPEPPSRWAGYTFIESRGGDFLYRVRDVNQRIAILEEILKDPLTAMNEYGIRLGVCGCCGRTLTAKDSRLRGLGPICAARILGAPTDAQLALIDQLGLRK